MEKDSSMSSYREMVLEHLFVGEIMRHAWFSDIKRIEILKPEVDDSGYDLVVEANNLIRHIQLKTTFQESKVARFNINIGLASKPGGCVIVLLFDPQTLKIGQSLWFGGLPGQKLPDISDYAIAKHTKGNAHGTKQQRPMIRVIPRIHFTKVEGIGVIVDKLFGIGHHSQKPGLTPSSLLEQKPTAQGRARRRGSERDYADKRQANIAAYYLSKFDHAELKFGNQTKTLNQIAKQLKVKYTTLKNARDSFDHHTGSHRKGWIRSLSPQYAKIHKKFKDYSEAELRQVVLRFMKAS